MLSKFSKLLFLISCTISCRSTNEFASQLSEADEYIKLKIDSSYEMPLSEISGLAFCFNSLATEYLHIVGDSKFEVLVAAKNSNVEPSYENMDLYSLFSDNPNTSSQWEAIACDKNKFAVLDEDPGSVYLVSKDLNQLTTIRLKSDSSILTGWQQNTNSRGEGMILLKNGHIIILKEKEPGLVIEFGPKDDAPHGLLPELIITGDDIFPVKLNSKLEYHPLKVWQMSPSTRSMMKDFSELAVSPEGRVYVLSQESNMIGRLEGKLNVDEQTATMREYYKLPSSIKYPEGMAIDRDGIFYIGSDIKSLNKKNVHKIIEF